MAKNKPPRPNDAISGTDLNRLMHSETAERGVDDGQDPADRVTAPHSLYNHSLYNHSLAHLPLPTLNLRIPCQSNNHRPRSQPHFAGTNHQHHADRQSQKKLHTTT